jgi:hypothetical protein
VSPIRTEKEAADYVGVSLRTFQRIKEGPRKIRLSPRRIGYYQIDLDRYLEERRTETACQAGEKE